MALSISTGKHAHVTSLSSTVGHIMGKVESSIVWACSAISVLLVYSSHVYIQFSCHTAATEEYCLLMWLQHITRLVIRLLTITSGRKTVLSNFYFGHYCKLLNLYKLLFLVINIWRVQMQKPLCRLKCSSKMSIFIRLLYLYCYFTFIAYKITYTLPLE